MELKNLSNFACVLAFAGESGSGKSTIAKLFRDCLRELGIKAEFATKYISGRKARTNEDPGAQIVDAIPDGCIKGQPREGQEIGYDLDEIKQMITNGIFPIVITKDLNFLAKLMALLNPTENVDTMNYNGRNLPVVRMRIYDIQSITPSNDEMISLTKARHPQFSEKEIMSELAGRSLSWESYYKERFSFSKISERVVNIKNLDHMKNYVANQLIGNETSEDENTLFGYAKLWSEYEIYNAAGVILGIYHRLATGAETYLADQNALKVLEQPPISPKRKK